MKFTMRDLCWALLIGGLFAISPQSSSKTSVSIVCGVLVAGGTLAYRHVFPRSPQTPALWVRPSMLLWAIAGLYVVLLSSVWHWLTIEYVHGIWWNGHSLFIPLLMTVLLDRILRKDGGTGEEASAWGLVWVGLGLSIVVIDCAIRSQYLSLLGLLLCLPGFSLLLLGARRTRLLWLPLALSIFMIPISTQLAIDLYLPQLISLGVVEFANLIGLTVVRVGTSVAIPEGGFSVSEDCSGFGGVYASYALVLVLGTYSRSRGRIAMLIAAPWVLAVVVNIPRAIALLLGVKFFGMPWLATFWHTASGIVAFWLALLPILLMADWRKLREELG